MILGAVLLACKLVVQGLNILCAPKWGLIFCVILTIGVIGFYVEFTVWEDSSWWEDQQDNRWHMLGVHVVIVAVWLADLIIYALIGCCVKA